LIVVFASAFACEKSANILKTKKSFFSDFIVFSLFVFIIN
jgi:hypothetical protein